MNSNVVTHDRFGGAETVERLRQAGVKVEDLLTDEQVAEMGLKEPAYGETLVGECTNEEAAMFYALWCEQADLEDRSRTLMGTILARLGTDIKDSDRGKPMSELLGEGRVEMSFNTEEEGELYFRVQQRVAHLHATFYWAVGERLSRHRDRLGVRSGMRLVTLQRRY